MPYRVELGDLRTACKQQVDLEDHAVISDAEWNGLISRAYGELCNIVMDAGLEYFETAAQLTAVGTNELDEPEDMLSMLAFAFLADAASGRYVDLRMLQPQERSRWTGMTGTARRFELVDRKILLYPTPPSGDVFQLRYVPQPADVTALADDDDIDVVTADGLEFVIWAVAVKACGKTEADPQLAIREREMARDRFTDSARQRAFLAPRRRIVEADDDGDGWPGW